MVMKKSSSSGSVSNINLQEQAEAPNPRGRPTSNVEVRAIDVNLAEVRLLNSRLRVLVSVVPAHMQRTLPAESGRYACMHVHRRLYALLSGVQMREALSKRQMA